MTAEHKAGWAEKAVVDISTLQRGFDLPKRLRKPGKFPLVTSSGPKDTQSEAKVTGPGVATGRSGSIGKVFYVDNDFWPLNTSLYVKDFHGNDPRFVYYFLQYVDLARFASGAGVPTLNRNDVHRERFWVPESTEEQRRIVAVLDEAFEGLSRARANAQANLENARELFENAVERELNAPGGDWRETTLEDICTGFEYGTSSKSQPEGTMPVLRMGNLQRGEIDWSSLVFTNDKADIEKYRLKPNDVLFNRTNSLKHVGKSAVFRGERAAIFAGYLIRVNWNPDLVDPEYLTIYLNSKPVRAHGRAVSGKSVNQANISASKLKKYKIALPPVKQQKDIVGLLSRLHAQTEKLSLVYRGKLQDLDDLRQSLLQKAFSGALT